MEPDPESTIGLCTPLSPTINTAHNLRVAECLREAELSPPERIPTLAKLPFIEYQSTLPSNSSAARSLLVQQRISEPNYRQPELQIRHVFRSHRRQEAKCNQDKWIFTKHEVAKAFDSLLSHPPLALPGIAQALLSHASITTLDDLWCHLHDPKLEKRKNSFLKGPRSSAVPDILWLEKATIQENHDYVRLMCQAGLGQKALNQAFSIALFKHSMSVMEVLLSFGAVASTSKNTIREHVKADDLSLVRLLLSARNTMSVEAWRYCIEPEVESLEASGKQSPNILLMCLAHLPEVACSSLLCKALESQNLQATAIILAYAAIDEDIRGARHLLCKLASRVQDNRCRHQFFAMLAECGLVVDSPILREELFKDVKTRQLPLVQLLADAGVSLDIEPHNAAYWAVSHMDLDILELFKNGTFSSPISYTLNFVPDSTSEASMIRLVDIFAHLGLAGEPLDSHLVRAVRKRHVELVPKLLRCGASVEFEQASAIQIALEYARFGILNTLLQHKCSPKILSVTIPTAMALEPRRTRLQAIQALVKKGVLSQELGIPLQRLVSEDGVVDSELIQLLLQHKAPVDGVGNDTENAILVAVRRGNISVLRMLCDTNPQNETLSKAVPIAFDVMHTCGYDTTLDMIKLLLQKGAAGLLIDQTLLTAVKQDDRLDIVHVLVEHGAEANFATGASYTIALETSNFKLLEILCARCPPSRTSMESVLYTAIDPRHYELQALELLISSTPSTAATLNALWAWEKFRGNPNMTVIVTCFLQHGLNVDLGDGALLCFAIVEKNVILLRRLLAANPSITSLKSAFQAANIVPSRNVEILVMGLLLEKAESAEIGQSKSLLKQTRAALDGDLEGLQLLLRHKAVVDCDYGNAIQTAAAAGSLEVLDMLLLSGPAPTTLNMACLTAASSRLSWDQKQSVFEHLLPANSGISVEDMSKLLADSIASLPDCTQLPKFLMERGAEVEYGTLALALVTAPHSLFMALASRIQNADTIVNIFRHVRETTMVPDRRYEIYQYLLGRGIPSDDVSEALLDSLKADELGDLSFPKLLLEHGADVGYKDCAAFSLALHANPPNALKLLSQYLVDDSMADIAFCLMRNTASLDPQVCMDIYRCLLIWNIRKSSIYDALVDNLKGSHSNISLVQLLLTKGADPNEEEGYCFLVASRAEAEPEFRALSKYAKLRVVLKVLLNAFKEEHKVVRWFKVCLEEQPYSKKINQDELLFQCMKKFPKGTALLELLLENGISASAKVNHSLCNGWQPESCTALIWALFSKPRIENDAILLLLARGRGAVLPAYSTPLKKVSAAFGCLLDKTRTPVLRALLDLDRDQILDYVIPGSLFGYLGTYPKVFNKELSLWDVADELPLHQAALYLGNFDAFCLMRGMETPNDGMLHSAALMALPKFVNLLLDTHDPNYKVEEFDNMIPLALVCVSKPHPWCKIANEESDWSTRQKETMKLLAHRTSPKWRDRSKTVLHIALESGLEVTKTMAEALDIFHDPEKDEKYLYMDKDGIEYSPDQYVQKLLDIDARKKQALINYFRKIGMKSRYFKRIEPNEGDQPTGYCGLPQTLATSWQAYPNEGDQSMDYYSLSYSYSVPSLYEETHSPWFDEESVSEEADVDLWQLGANVPEGSDEDDWESISGGDECFCESDSDS